MTDISQPSIARSLPALLDRWNEAGVSDSLLSSALGVSAVSVARWHTGSAYPQTGCREKVDALDRLCRQLPASFGEDYDRALQAWLHADNRYLGGLKPLEALKAGRFDRVEAALVALDEGFFV